MRNVVRLYSGSSAVLGLLAGSWVVISRSRVISPRIWVISIHALLITLLMTTHEPPSGCCSVNSQRQAQWSW